MSETKKFLQETQWQFWRKRNPLTKLGPHMLAAILVEDLANHEHPFNDWRDNENPIPEKADAWVETAVNVYQLSILLDALDRKFGADVAESVRSNLITLLNAKIKLRFPGDTIQQFFDAVRTGRALPEQEQTFADNPAIQLDSNVAKAFLSVVSEPEDEKNALFPKLARSLSIGRISAESFFNPLTTEMDFRPESTFGFSKPDEISLNWSEATGCFERHLQRRHNNALFPPERRRITADDLVEAKSRDQADLEQLREESQKFIDEITSPPRPGRIAFSEIYKWREKIEEFLMRTAAIGDIANEVRNRLRAVYEGIVKSLRDNCPPERKTQLEAALAKSESYQQTFSNQFLAQFNRKDTPITPVDLLPSLLVEDVNTVRVMASVMASVLQINLLFGKDAVVLIEDAKKEGYIVPDAAEKLRVLSESKPTLLF